MAITEKNEQNVLNMMKHDSQWHWFQNQFPIIIIFIEITKLGALNSLTSLAQAQYET